MFSGHGTSSNFGETSLYRYLHRAGCGSGILLLYD